MSGGGVDALAHAEGGTVAVPVEKAAGVSGIAADHAFDTEARTGTPVLLPKPTQAELAARINVSAPTLSRCMEDRSAPELRILWDAADDVYEVMKWRKLAVKNRG